MGKERWISLGALAVIPLLGFSRDIKRRVNEEQDYRCAMCGCRVKYLQSHHCVPENALKGAGIKGKNIKENAVGLCSGEKGRGEGSPDDCHEIADRKAIRERLFWKNGEFVPLSEVDKDTYFNNRNGRNTELPEFRPRKKKKRRSR